MKMPKFPANSKVSLQIYVTDAGHISVFSVILLYFGYRPQMCISRIQYTYIFKCQNLYRINTHIFGHIYIFLWMPTTYVH